MLKGIIRYSDCLLAVMIFKCFGIFVFLFKASHLTTLVDCLLIFCYIMDNKDFGLWLTLKIHMLHFLAMILLIMYLQSVIVAY